MIDEDRSHLGRQTMFDRVLTRGTCLGRTSTCADVIEGGNEIACIGGAFFALGRQYAPDMDGMCVEANRRADVQLECDAHDMSAEAGSQSHGSFDAIGCRGRRIADHRKENVPDRHRRAPRRK